MTIQALGFIETSTVTAMFLLGKDQKSRTADGVLRLRDVHGDEIDVADLPILTAWKGARALLTRLRAVAAPIFEGVTPELGRVWIEVLPPSAGTPWEQEIGDYAETHVRTRTCLIPSPGAVSFSGLASAGLGVGIVNLIDHRQLCSETNHGEHVRVHLVADLRIPEPAST